MLKYIGDFEKLKDFGFEFSEKHNEWRFTNDESSEVLIIQTNGYIAFEKNDGGIYFNIIEDLLYKLYDLIDAGLVVKVEDN